MFDCARATWRAGFLVAVCAAVWLVDSGGALASTATTATFSTAGCQTWIAPPGLSGDVQIAAVGAAGESVGGGGGHGGAGDAVQATLSGLAPGDTLFVCVDSGGGAGGAAEAPGEPAGGAGGGASGVSLGSNFSEPLVVAAGGGGGASGTMHDGGSAGFISGSPGDGVASEDIGGGGAGGNEVPLMGGAGGAGGNADNGGSGGVSSSAGPGAGGNGGEGGGASGGGGGAGFYGGGGGGGGNLPQAGGGGGGADHCDGGCVVLGGVGTGTAAGTAVGDAQVTLSYQANAATTTTVAAPASGTTNTPITLGSIGSSLSGATGDATGTITFTVFGPQTTAPTSCTSGGTTVGTATVSGDNTYNPSAGFTPTSSGTYWWYASYGGDANNAVSNSGCGAGMTSTTVTDPADLSIINVGSPNPVVSGKRLTYTITATNTGQQTATGVSVIDQLPASGMFVSTSITQGSCTRSVSGPNKNKDGTVTCNAGSLTGGSSVKITIVITATTKGTLSNWATVTATNVTVDGDDSDAASNIVTGT